MGIKITSDDRGPVKVWRSEKKGYVSYAIGVSKKEGDNWINKYQPVRFLKGVDVPNASEITIKNAFPTLDTWVKDGQQFSRIVWMIMDFEGPRQKSAVDNYNTSDAELPDSFNEADEDIPF